jgi:hypothetical protein
MAFRPSQIYLQGLDSESIQKKNQINSFQTQQNIIAGFRY